MQLLVTRRYLLALAAASLLTAVVVGIPTDLLPNPWFQRMTPVRTLDIVLWPVVSLSVGALLATYALPASRGSDGIGGGAGGGLLGTLAVGCPVCNKLVVAVLGTSGALTYFEPIQPALGFAAVGLAVYSLRRRIVALERGCPVPPRGVAGGVAG
ncbi:MAG TPA: hypothetical protein VJT68_08265 [Thermoleophilaceae bacterium]|nr:hypothetical protein [Thermoleophilaceae bacterium]